jgi:hypothetical protein
MYDRFTERARKVMQLSNQEALRRQHEQIGTEHMLVGLIREEKGLAASALRSLNVDLKKVEEEIDKISPTGLNAPSSNKLPPSSGAKKAIIHAFEEVKHAKSPNVDTEHILLGLLHVVDSKAGHVLEKLGVPVDSVRTQLLQMLTGDQEVAQSVAVDDDMSDEYNFSQPAAKKTHKKIVPLKDREPPPEPPIAETKGEQALEAEHDEGLFPGPPMAAPVVNAGVTSAKAPANMSSSGKNGDPYAQPVPMATAVAVAAPAGVAPRLALGPHAADNALRQALSMCWSILPDDRKNVAEAEAELRRLLERALRDFKEDAKAFGME